MRAWKLELASLLLVFAATAAVEAQTYSVIDLGTLGGSSSRAFGLNDNGEVVGYAATATAIHAFLYSNGSMTDLGTLGGTSSQAYGINNSGQVVGLAYVDGLVYRAFLYANGTMTDLGTLGGNSSKANGINDNGQIVGLSLSAQGGAAAFFYSNGTMTGISGANEAFAINTSEQIVGYNYSIQAFMYSNGTMTNLGTLGGNQSVAYDINESGQIVGYADTVPGTASPHGFLYSEGSMSDIGLLPGGTYNYARSINDSGQIVGQCTVDGDAIYHAYLFSNGSITDLNDLIPADSGWVLEAAYAINNNGQIAGYGRHNGQERAFLLTPGIPEAWTLNWPDRRSPWTRLENVFTATEAECTWPFTSRMVGPWECIQGSITCSDEVPRQAFALVTNHGLTGILIQRQFSPIVLLYGQKTSPTQVTKVSATQTTLEATPPSAARPSAVKPRLSTTLRAR